MQIRARSPLRLGLAGGGTDISLYSDVYGGAILNATISMYAYATLNTEDNGKNLSDSVFDRLVSPLQLNFSSPDRSEYESLTITEAAPLPLNGRFSLHKGVFNRLLRDYPHEIISALNTARQMELTTYVDAPAGSGLGSSSTLTVSIIGVFRHWAKLPLGDYDIAHLAYDIERIDLNMSGGKQDQYAATFGGFNFMEFYKDDRVIVNPLRIRPDYLSELEFNMLLFHTGDSRVSSTIIEAQKANVTQNKVNSLEAMHHLKEQAISMKEAILKGQFYRIGEILEMGWQNKKKTAKEVSNPKIDRIYEAARSAGATGGKISGAGGGGFMILFCPQNTRYKVIQALQEFGGEFRRYNFTETGVTTWRV